MRNCPRRCCLCSVRAHKGRYLWESLDPEVPTEGPTDPWKSWRHGQLRETATSAAAVVGIEALLQRVFINLPQSKNILDYNYCT